MISRYVFVCFYFLSFFLINRWYDLYEYYSHFSTHRSFAQRFLPTNQLNIKQLQYILNLRGLSYVNINEKYDLIKMVEQTGSVRENELSEPIEDHTKRPMAIFSSYRQLIDFVDDCKDTIWLVHLLPNEDRRQSLVHLASDKWQAIERRLSILNIQTGILNCTTNEYSNLCRTLKSERFVLLVPSINRRSTNIYFYDIYSTKHYDYQYILRWLSKTLENHVNKDFDWYELPVEKRSIVEFRINSHSFLSTLPIYYFPLLYRYGSTINFRLTVQENEDFQIKFFSQNSTTDGYIYNDGNRSHYFHEFYSFRSLNFFLSCLTINTQTIMSIYFVVINIYFLYDIYLVRSLSLLKRISIINIISGLFWSICLTCLPTRSIDYILQMISFYLIQCSLHSNILMFLRNDLFLYSIMSKWICYPAMIILHIGMGLCFRWYLKGQFGSITNDIQNDVMIIDQAHALCSKVWQFIICFLFSDQGPNEHTNNTLLQYFSQDSLWLNHHSPLIINPNVDTPSRPSTDLTRLPVWRFTIQRRKTTHGASEYYSDIELEHSDSTKEHDSTWKKSFIHRRITNLVSLSQQDNCYTSESDENNNSLNAHLEQMNSSQIYQCSICLEKYFNNVYICTLPCLHHFHRKCLFDWLGNSEQSTCPLCRSPVMN